MNKLLKIVLPLIGKRGLLKYSFTGILSGLFSFLFINSVTRIIGQIIAGNYTMVSRENVIILAGIILIFVWIRRTLSVMIINLSQTLFWKLRKRILLLILRANYQQLLSRKAKIQSTILSDVYTLTEASLNVIQFFTASILALSCFVYLLSISMMLFFITLFVASIGVTIYHWGSIKNLRAFKLARDLENNFQEQFGSILHGFKDIYMEPKKGKFIYDRKITNIAHAAFKNNTSAFIGFLNNQITGQILFYMLISSVLLFFSLRLKIKSSDTVTYIFTLLYLLGSIETIMALLPGLARAKVASNHLMTLSSELEEVNFDNPEPSRYVSKDEFEQINVSGLEFVYKTEDQPFGIGPIDLEIRKGEAIFIYGGNGSGKTTLIYSILGLCFPSAGEISLNDVTVDSGNYADYRTVFSVVFNDFYLFNELMTNDHPDVCKWEYYVRLFELENKVKLSGTVLSTTELSAGQRKRLALIATLLEDKPVLILDEWAADQDPYFKRKFYTEIIPLLKKDGFTIIAITHDDNYYFCADKLYKMDYGKLVPERINAYETFVIT
ncbi:MAG TPA: cyclic peptide export ABC transporter [Puia sp.]